MTEQGFLQRVLWFNTAADEFNTKEGTRGEDASDGKEER